MGETTGIGWTDHTFNPWWGCVKVSPGCKFCYADVLSNRYGHHVWGVDAPRRFFGDKHWNEPLKWNRKAEAEGVRKKVFCGSMCDVFEIRSDLREHQRRLWNLISETPWLDWQLLTKRPEEIVRNVPAYWLSHWPHNVWIGTSVENQEQADIRIPIMAELRAYNPPVIFLSIEPLIGHVELDKAYWDKSWHIENNEVILQTPANWLIVGGESGNIKQIRKMELGWAKDLVDFGKMNNIPVFVKQLGTGHTRGKGDDINEWPDELKVQEFPNGH